MSLNTLIDSNVAILRQAIELLGKLSEEQYCHSEACGAPSSVGKHVRHIIEHYQSFLSGLNAGVINYNTRPRCAAAETSRQFASDAVQLLIGQLEQIDTPTLDLDQLIKVYLQTTVCGAAEPSVRSTHARELMFLHGHAVHHFAQMSSQLQLMDSGIDAGQLGKAPSTLEYEAKLLAKNSRLQAKSVVR
ncbi:MAG: DinB family protein [Pseudomonadota bacterium]